MKQTKMAKSNGSKLRMTRYRISSPAVLLIALASMVSCKDKAAEPKLEAEQTQKEQKKVVLADLAAPRGVLAYGGVDKLEEVVGQIAGLLAKVAPPGAVSLNTISQMLQKELQLTNPDALDLSKPLRFIVLDPKKDPKSPVVLLVGTKGKDKLVKTLPASKREKAEGNAYAYGPLYLNFLDDVALFSYRPDAFSQHKQFLSTLLQTTLPGQLAAVVSVQNIMTVYGADLQQSLDQAQKAMAELKTAKAEMKSFAPKAIFDWLANTPKKLDRLLISTSLPGKDGLFSLDLHPKAGNDLGRTFSQLVGPSGKLEDRLPASSPFFTRFALSPDQGLGFLKEMMKWSLSMGATAGFTFPEKTLEKVEQFWRATSGEMVMGLMPKPDGDGAALVMLTGIRDEDKARQTYREMMKVYQDKAMNKSLAKSGVTITFKPDAYKIGQTSVDTSITKMKTHPADMKSPLSELLKEMFQGSIAITSQAMYFVYGSAGKTVLEAFLNGKTTGGLSEDPGVVRARRHAMPENFLFAYVQPLEVMRLISASFKDALPPTPPPKPTAPGGLSFSASGKGGVLRVGFHVPLELVQDMMQLAGSFMRRR